MIRQFTYKDFKELQPYEGHLNRGYYGRYIYGLRRKDFNTLVEKYNDMGYSQHMEYSCNRCLLQLTSTLGRLYFEFKLELEKMQEQETKKNQKRKVGQYNTDGVIVKEYESVTQAINETGVTKGNIYKALKDNTPIDGMVFKYIE